MGFKMSTSPGEIDLNCDAFPIDAPTEGFDFEGSIYSAHPSLDFDPFREIDVHEVGDILMDGSILEDIDGRVCMGDDEMSRVREARSGKKATAVEELVDTETLYGNDTDSVTSGEFATKSYVEDKFVVSDLVWGKVRSHPWWPGQIFEATASSAKAMKYFKRGSFLIAYFGDQSFAWNKPSLLKPFREYFSQLEKQSNMDAFRDAVDGALNEISRRVEFGLACPCLPHEEYSLLKTQNIVNAGIREEYSIGRNGGDRFSGVDSFEPVKLVKYVKALAQLQWDETDRLELVLAEAQLLAFYRTKGYFQLPRFEMLGGLWEEGVEIPISAEKCDLAEGVEASDIAVSLFSDSNIHVRGEPTSKNGCYIKERCMSDILTDNFSGLGRKCKAIDSVHDLSSVEYKKNIVSVMPGDSYLQQSQSQSQSSNIGDKIHRVAMELNERDNIFKFDDEMAEIVTIDAKKENSGNSKGRGSGKKRGRPKKIPEVDELDDVLLIVTGDNRRISQSGRGRKRSKKNTEAIPVNNDAPESVTHDNKRNGETKKRRGRPKKIQVENDSNQVPGTRLENDSKVVPEARSENYSREVPEIGVENNSNKVPEFQVENNSNKVPEFQVENDSNQVPETRLENDLKEVPEIRVENYWNEVPEIPEIRVEKDSNNVPETRAENDSNETPETVTNGKKTSSGKRRGRPKKIPMMENGSTNATSSQRRRKRKKMITMEHDLHSQLSMAAQDPLRIFPSLNPMVSFFSDFRNSVCSKTSLDLETPEFKASMDSYFPIPEPEIAPPDFSSSPQTIFPDVGIKTGDQSICDHKITSGIDHVDPNLSWNQHSVADAGIETLGQSICDHQISAGSDLLLSHMGWNHQTIVPDVGIQAEDQSQSIYDHQLATGSGLVLPNLGWNHQSIVQEIHADNHHQFATGINHVDPNMFWNHQTTVPEDRSICDHDHGIAFRTEPEYPNSGSNHQTVVLDDGMEVEDQSIFAQQSKDLGWGHPAIVPDHGIQIDHRNEPMESNSSWKETEKLEEEEEEEEEQTPTALILCFTDLNSVPSIKRLNDIFRVYGYLEESETKVMKNSFSAKVVFKKRCDAEVAFSSAGKFSIFGPSLVSYRLKYLSSVRRKALSCKNRRSKKEGNA